MLILAGLGNPGAKYQHNRHNIGFMAVDEIARRWSFSPWRSKFQGLTAEGTIGPERVILLKPQTFMNESGRSVGEALKFFKLEPDSLVVFHDELDLAPGRFRMKAGGGTAGHNGLRSIGGQIGPYFRRGRMGIGHPGHKEQVLGYVLSDFHKVETPWVRAMSEACAEAAPMLVAGEDERYQGEVMRLAPAEKLDPRKTARGEP
ncbi:MAG TPA: aminoacyl-tRNA hydrolase [Caulobacteraceae bacterium]|jgi:PTH1 family peptidyl-tRNA hydrolase|nr:aminoacyl-tRNA hydrolase [Caulobacteraceae bacterium]